MNINRGMNMTEKTNNPVNPYKSIFLIIIMSVMALYSFSTAYSSEPEGKNSGEIKNNVYNLYNREMGRIDEFGNVYNAYGRKLGSVDPEGKIHNVSDLVIGEVKPGGSVLNQSGTVLGSVNDQGDIFNVSGRKLGSVKDVSNIQFIGGAARLIFLK